MALRNFLILTVVVIFLAASCFGGNIVGNKDSKVLHLKSCYLVKKMKSKNKTYFDTIEQGLKKGYSVCDICIDVERKK